MVQPAPSPETWAWQEIRAGRVADFNARLNNAPDPARPDGWGDDRRLSAEFLRRIFCDPASRDAIPPEGVRIVGAWLPEGLALPDLHLNRQLWLEKSRFDQPIDFSRAKIDGHLSLEGIFVAAAIEAASIMLAAAEVDGRLHFNGATIAGKLDFNDLHVTRHLLMTANKEGRAASFQDIDLTYARIDGVLSFVGATVAGKLEMNGLHVAQSLMLSRQDSRASFAQVDLTTAQVDGLLCLDGATVTGPLAMNDLHVGQSLFLRGSADNPARFADIDIGNARIDGHLELNGATVTGTLAMNGLSVGQNLFMDGTAQAPAGFAAVQLSNARIGGSVSLSDARLGGAFTAEDAHIGADLRLRNLDAGTAGAAGATASLKFMTVVGNADFTGTRFFRLDLSAAAIGDELRLEWPAQGSVILRNAHAAVLQDSGQTLPGFVELEGFDYAQLRDDDGQAQAPQIGLKWYVDWLARDTSYSPQPYEHLAGVFRAAGRPGDAAAILYESRERARHEAERVRWRLSSGATLPLPGWRYWGLTLLRATTGYGLGSRYFRCLWWIAGFTLVGTFVVHGGATLTPPAPFAWSDSVVYSFEKLIPLVELEKFDKVRLDEVARYYFYFHRLVGYLLALFLGAGLGGLTQKS